jgi:hypothetical protein
MRMIRLALFCIFAGGFGASSVTWPNCSSSSLVGEEEEERWIPKELAKSRRNCGDGITVTVHHFRRGVASISALSPEFVVMFHAGMFMHGD